MELATAAQDASDSLLPEDEFDKYKRKEEEEGEEGEQQNKGSSLQNEDDDLGM